MKNILTKQNILLISILSLLTVINANTPFFKVR
jgi:hypothetical protein